MKEAYERLQQARMAAGFETPKAASDYFGWNEHTYKSHDNGTRGLKRSIAEKYGAAFKVSPAWLLTGENGLQVQPKSHTVITVPVYGAAAGGVWMESDDISTDDIKEIPVIPDARFPQLAQYARKVVGNSVSNRVKDGEYCIFVKYDAYPGGPKNGALVDVERHRSGLREHTVKVFMGRNLQTDSAELKKQTVQNMTNGDSDTEVRVVGVAIGAFRIF